MHITHKSPSLPQAGDTVVYRENVCEVLSYDFYTDDLEIMTVRGTLFIKRLDIE